MCEDLLRYFISKKKAADKKWIYFDSPIRKKLWVGHCLQTHY